MRFHFPLVLALLLLALIAALANARGPYSARIVTAEVSLDGQVVLRGSTSDDGRPDADAVWEYLRQLSLTPTAKLASVAPERREDHEGGAFSLLGRAEPERRGADGGPWRHADIQLDIAYGGAAELRTLRLIPTAKPGEWRVDLAAIEGWFGLRTIRREWAARLEEPRRKKL